MSEHYIEGYRGNVGLLNSGATLIRSGSLPCFLRWALPPLASIAALLPITATAAPITFAFEARITDVDTPRTQSLFNQSFFVGDMVRGTYRFESSTPDAAPADASWGSYPKDVKSFGFGLHGAGGSFQLPGLRGVDRGGGISVFDNDDSYTVSSEMGYMTPSQWSDFQAQREADTAALVKHLRSTYTPEAALVIGTVCTSHWCDLLKSLSVGGIVGGVPLGGAYVLKPRIEMPEFDTEDPFFVPGPPTKVAITGDGLLLVPPDFSLFSSPIFALDVETLGLLGDKSRLLTAELTSLTLTTSPPLFPDPSAPLDQLPATLTSLSMPLLEDYLESQRLAVPEPPTLWLFAVGLVLVLVSAMCGTRAKPALN